MIALLWVKTLILGIIKVYTKFIWLLLHFNNVLFNFSILSTDWCCIQILRIIFIWRIPRNIIQFIFYLVFPIHCLKRIIFIDLTSKSKIIFIFLFVVFLLWLVFGKIFFNFKDIILFLKNILASILKFCKIIESACRATIHGILLLLFWFVKANVFFCLCCYPALFST